jgi:hypothetical protein
MIEAIICIYFLTIPLFTVNFPISDDFALLDFLNKFIQADNFKEEIQLIFKQHNEHRIVTVKLVFLIYHKLFGSINFIHLAFFGNLAILGIYFALIRQIPEGTDPNKRLALIVACLLFQYGSAESMIWAMASIQNYSALFFTILTMALLKRDILVYFILAMSSAVLATFTQGNGIIILIIGGFYILSQKRYHHFTIWIFVTIAAVYFYFIGYQAPVNHSDPFQFYTQIGNIILFMLAFLGSAFGLGGSNYPLLSNFFLVPTVGIGLWVCLTTLFLSYQKKYQDGNILIWINLFIILTSFTAAVSRVNFGLSQALVSRYHVNSSIIIASTILLCHQYVNFQTIIKSAISNYRSKLLMILFVLYTIFTFPMIYYFSYKIYEPIKNGGILFPIKENAMDILKQARLNGIYGV